MTLFADSAHQNQIGFQDPATPIMEGIIDLHHEVFFYLVIIVTAITWIMIRVVWLFNSKNNTKAIVFSHNTLLEVVWTIIPAIILVVIAIPSFGLLYSMDEMIDPAVTVKAVGHQWYWSYEYSDYATISGDSVVFDSYMIPEDELEVGQHRLLEVDNSVYLPTKTHVRIVTTSTDVIHSWAVPALGVKVDALPGRLNQISVFIDREGTYYGQCSEICGVNHGFMPIVVKGVSLDDFLDYMYVKVSS